MTDISVTRIFFHKTLSMNCAAQNISWLYLSYGTSGSIGDYVIKQSTTLRVTWVQQNCRKSTQKYNSWKIQHLQLFLPTSFLLHSFPHSRSLKQSFGSSCDLLNSLFHQNEIVERATWRRSKVEVLDENRNGSCISLAVTKHYKVIHSPSVKKNQTNPNQNQNQQPQALLQ